MKYISILLLLPALLSAQEILVSEYYNAQNNSETEWVELIVTEENLDLSDYKLRDNSDIDGSPTQWQGGVIFQNQNFWKDLPKGLAILIYLREDQSINYDYDISDGLIILNAEDSNYFEKFCEDCSVDPQSWEETSLIIERSADIVQILNPNEENVHAIGHTLQDIGDFANLNGLISDINLPNGNSMVVFPGNVLSDYIIGFDNNQDYLKSSSIQTPGYANNLGSFEEDNAKFWYDLKSTYWQDPVLELSKQSIGFLLDWNNIESSPNSSLFGYMIVRYEGDSYTEPINGNIYNEGDLIGSGRVIRVVNSEIETVFNDQTANKCGVTYTYYVYTYRFDNGDDEDRISYYKGLGRAYNLIDVAEASIDRNDIQSFNIVSISGDETICYPIGENPENYSITLATTLQQTDKLRFIWIKDDEEIFKSSVPGEFAQIQASESGIYIAQVINEEDCLKLSNNIVDISIQEKTDYFISYNSVFTYSDTLAITCDQGNGVLLSTDSENPNARIDWYLSNGGGEGDLIQANSPDFNATFEAEYFAVVSDGACIDTTNLFEFEYADLTLTLDKSEIEIITDIGTAKQENFELTNNGEISQEFNINDFDLPNGISIVSPALPFILEPDDSQEIVISYLSNIEESFIEDLTIYSDCFEEYNVSIKAAANNGDIAVIPNSIIFPTLVSCGQTGTDTTITIINNSPEEIQIQEAQFNEQFKVEGLPLNLDGNSSLELTVIFNTQVIGQYNSQLLIPYTRNGLTSDIELSLSGRVANPEITIDTNLIDFGIVAQCESKKDTTIMIENNSGVDFTIPNINVSDFSTLNTPLFIPKNETRGLEIRFERFGVGLSDAIAGFDLQPCNVSQSLRFIGEKRELEIKPENEIMNFGNNLICENPYIDTLRNRLTISDEFKKSIVIDSIITPDNLNISLEVGDEIINGTPFEITVNLTEEVNISEVISIRVLPCNNWYNIPVILSTQKPELDFQDTLRFQDVLIGTNETKQNIFGNLSSIDIRFTLLPLSEQDVFTFDLNEKFLPFGVSNLPLDFSYMPNSESSEDTLLVQVVMTEPCNKVDTLILIGNAFTETPEFANLKYSINGKEELDLKENAVYSVDLEITSNDIENLAITNSEFIISYNPFALNISSISDNTDDSVILSYDNNIEDGRLKVELDLSTIEEYQFFNFLEFEASPLLGNELVTELNFIELFASGNTNFNIESDSLTLNISGNCQLEERLISVSNSVELNINGGEINTGNLEIEFSIVTTDITQIKLINLESGTSMKLVEGSLKPGSYKITLSQSELSSGFYYIQMNSGISKRESKFIQVN